MWMPTADKWIKDVLSAIASTPYSVHVPKEPEISFREVAEAQGPQFNPKVALSRQVYIIEKYGLTRGRPSKGKLCRNRIMGELAKTAEGRIRTAAAAVPMDQTVAELGQQHWADLQRSWTGSARV